MNNNEPISFFSDNYYISHLENIVKMLNKKINIKQNLKAQRRNLMLETFEYAKLDTLRYLKHKIIERDLNEIKVDIKIKMKNIQNKNNENFLCNSNKMHEIKYSILKHFTGNSDKINTTHSSSNNNYFTLKNQDQAQAQAQDNNNKFCFNTLGNEREFIKNKKLVQFITVEKNNTSIPISKKNTNIALKENKFLSLFNNITKSTLDNLNKYKTNQNEKYIYLIENNNALPDLLGIYQLKDNGLKKVFANKKAAYILPNALSFKSIKHIFMLKSQKFIELETAKSIKNEMNLLEILSALHKCDAVNI